MSNNWAEVNALLHRLDSKLDSILELIEAKKQDEDFVEYDNAGDEFPGLDVGEEFPGIYEGLK